MAKPGLGRQELAPHLMCDVGHQPQLRLLRRVGNRIAVPYRAETALCRQTELLAREVAARPLDALDDFLARFELNALGRDEPEDDAFVARDIAQRLERSGAPVIVFEQEAREVARSEEH